MTTEAPVLPVDLPLRDQLALDRTTLANRRTWLAYVRTSLAMFVTGASFHQFFEVGAMRVVGWILLGASVPTFLAGLMRTRHQSARLAQLEATERARIAAES